jgi:hypothetical protein
MARRIDYGNLMHRAMRGLIMTVLRDVQKRGLPGAHHFFITFDTTAPGVEMADWLRARYPAEMTVVLQHWYDDLQVTDTGFAVTLNFGNNPERVKVPFDSLRTFVDPSVEFGLRFETHDETEGDEATEGGAPETDDDPDDDPPPQDAQIVRLDRFRKT